MCMRQRSPLLSVSLCCVALVDAWALQHQHQAPSRAAKTSSTVQKYPQPRCDAACPSIPPSVTCLQATGLLLSSWCSFLPPTGWLGVVGRARRFRSPAYAPTHAGAIVPFVLMWQARPSYALVMPDKPYCFSLCICVLVYARAHVCVQECAHRHISACVYTSATTAHVHMFKACRLGL
jgi:hypothetical protein